MIAMLPILIPIITALIEGTPGMIKSAKSAIDAMKSHPDYNDPAVKAQVNALEQRLINTARAVAAYTPRPIQQS